MQPDWNLILQLADKREIKLSALLYQAFKQAQNNARARELITALLKGKSVESLIQEDAAQLAAKIGSILTDTAAGIMPQAAVIAAAGVVATINAAAARGRSAMRLAADKNGLVSGKLAGKEFRIDLGFNMRNPLANQAISNFGADLVKQISDQTRQNIRNTLNDAFKHGGHPYEQARMIRNVVGLTELQAKRVEKFRDELVKTGKLTADKIDKLTAKYSDGIIRDRAKNIARTETMRAANAGQQFAWNAAFDKGLINNSFRKKWILTPDDRLCPVCASMSGKLADVKGKFDDPLGGKIEYPPLHPRCRCCCSLVESTGETNSTDAVGSGIIVSEINLQQFSAATDDIKRKIDSGELPLKLRQQKQDKHVLGTEKYKLALNNERLNDTGFKPSYMTIDNIQAFVTSKSGTGVLTMSKDGGIREKIESGAIVGKFWNQYTQEYEDTRCAIIVYSKTGTHVFPRREKR